MKWLLMGGAGFTGRFLIESLEQEFSDDEIILADIQELSDLKWKQYKTDFRKSHQIFHLLQEVSPNYIVNLAGIFKSENIMLSIQINCLTLAHICEFYKNNIKKLKGILAIGSSSQYGPLAPNSPFPDEEYPCNPITLYGWTKLMQEKIGLEYYQRHNIPIFFTRTANLLGPGLSEDLIVPTILNQLKNAKQHGTKPKIKLINLNAGRDFIDVRDAVQAYIKLITNPDCVGTIFNIGSGRVTMLKEVISIIKNVLEIEEIIVSGGRSEIPDIHAINCSKVKTALDWSPKINLISSLDCMIVSLNKDSSFCGLYTK